MGFTEIFYYPDFGIKNRAGYYQKTKGQGQNTLGKHLDKTSFVKCFYPFSSGFPNSAQEGSDKNHHTGTGKPDKTDIVKSTKYNTGAGTRFIPEKMINDLVH